jgi:hypothetical protein
MKRTLPLLLLALGACSTPQYLHKGVQDGVELAYRWNHPPGKPSELLVRMKNTTAEDRTCIRAGQTLNGKLNGIYFLPTTLTTEQIKSGDADAELTRSEVGRTACE